MPPPIDPIWAATLASAQREREQMEQSTFSPHTRVELKMSAKGERYWDISVSVAEGNEHEIGRRIQALDQELRERFGDPAGVR